MFSSSERPDLDLQSNDVCLHSDGVCVCSEEVTSRHLTSFSIDMILLKVQYCDFQERLKASSTHGNKN